MSISPVGSKLGLRLGDSVGSILGLRLGDSVSFIVGLRLGDSVSSIVGLRLGDSVGLAVVGFVEGSSEGDADTDNPVCSHVAIQSASFENR
jgi:hypothetical protein